MNTQALARAGLSYFPSLERCAQFMTSCKDAVAQQLFSIASYTTDPACYAHLNYRLRSVAHVLYPNDSKITYCARQVLFGIKICGWAMIASVTSLPAIALRFIATHLEAKPFYQVKIKQENLPLNNSYFTVLSGNTAMAPAGYVISDANVLPEWYIRKNASGKQSCRLEDIIEIIKKQNADVVCLSEVFETKVATHLCQELASEGYSHFFHSMGRRALGPPSGLWFASKLPLKSFVFTPFPQDTLVGRTKNCSKGWYEAEIVIGNGTFATVIGTHLQHSEIPRCSKPEEVEGRKKQMDLIIAQVDAMKDRCVLVAGDLNLGNEEYRDSKWTNRFKYSIGNMGCWTEPHASTWMGDEACVRLARGPEATISQPMNLDYMMLKEGESSLNKKIVKIPYDSKVLQPSAISDHNWIKGTISI